MADTASVASAPSASVIPPLKALTLDQIAAGLDGGAFTVVQLVQAHLDQIARFDGYLHAVLQLNPNALAIAAALDDERAKTGRRSLLHGVPVLVKDNVATHEPLEATAGSLALLGAKPVRENPAITRLRAAGCVLLGTTNCSEWANFRSRPSDSGWSARGGQTYGAYHARQDPSGSSSGSGVAVDMGFCVLAVGTETSGSIISPSTQNGIVGLKPTTGLVSRDAVVPISPVQDTPGPMARTVADAAAMLTVMAGRDPHDPKTNEIPFAVVPDYRAAATTGSVGGGGGANGSAFRVGIPRNLLRKLPRRVLAAFEDRVVAPLRDQHGVVVVDCACPGLVRFLALSPAQQTDYMAGEFHDALPQYLATLAANPQGIDSLAALCAFLKATPGEEYGEDDAPETKTTTDEDKDDEADDDADADDDGPADTGTTTPVRDTPASAAPNPSPPPRRNIRRLEQTMRITRDSAEFAAARANAAYFAGPGGIQGALDGTSTADDGADGADSAGHPNNPDDIASPPVDALLLPTSAGTANYFAACEGHPQITIPLAYHGAAAKVKYNPSGRLVDTGPNMPFGVSVIGRKYSEETLMPLCATIEKLTRARDEAEDRRLAHLRG
ncbi:Amidase [Niveomyces insectorum RCEF 264]|uniref:Amidase n=1 Tax=Niveomyces insectorum RCEF 264 TaxID=1081102 RepID=A0A167VKI7_9HYPO|nr:Amidase [Niveomyces insectorum RCEF 264]